MALTFDRFVRFRELTEILEGWAESHPQLFQLTSLGKSYEDRDVWLATVTNGGTGPASEKPAIWIDANIHATELTGSMAALYLLNKLRHRLRHRRESHPRPRHPRLLRRASHQSRRRRAGAGRAPHVRALVGPALPAHRPAGRPDRPGHGRRRSHLVDADPRSQRDVEGVDRRSPSARGRASPTRTVPVRTTGCSPKARSRTTTAHDQGRAGARWVST